MRSLLALLVLTPSSAAAEAPRYGFSPKVEIHAGNGDLFMGELEIDAAWGESALHAAIAVGSVMALPGVDGGRAYLLRAGGTRFGCATEIVCGGAGASVGIQRLRVDGYDEFGGPSGDDLVYYTEVEYSAFVDGRLIVQLRLDDALALELAFASRLHDIVHDDLALELLGAAGFRYRF